MRKTIYFIRHAATQANLSGDMVKDYDSFHILPFDRKKKWFDYNKFDAYFGMVALNSPIFVSDTYRTFETAHTLFGNKRNIKTLKSLNEFNCEGLGNKKFWEISEDEFSQLVKLTPSEMKENTEIMIKDILAKMGAKSNATCISHGMKIRYLIWYLKGNSNISAYKVINSMDGVKFGNLDILKLKLDVKLDEWSIIDYNIGNY